MANPDRREFLKIAGAGACVTAAPGACGCAAEAAEKPDHFVPVQKRFDPRWVKALFARGSRKPYRGRELETIGMPCGGVCAGQLYVRGDGTLAQWWIANNPHNTGYGLYFKVTTPAGTYPQAYQTFRPVSPVEQGFAIRVAGEGAPEVRELSRDGFDDIRFYGEYPVATIEYGSRERPLPVRVRGEVFSPFIPLNADDSSLPATILRYTVTNTSSRPLDVSIAGWLQNLVMLNQRGRIQARSRNRVETAGGRTFVRMDAVAAGPDALIERRSEPFDGFDAAQLKQWAESKGKGRIESRPFRIRERYLAFQLAGGRIPLQSAMHLVVDGERVRTTIGGRGRGLQNTYWDLSELAGREARLEIVDEGAAPADRVRVEDVRFTNLPPLPNEEFTPDHPQFGEVALTALDSAASATASWTSRQDMLGELARDRRLGGPREAVHPIGAPRCGAVASEARLEPGAEKQFTFLLTWYFPNRGQDKRGQGGWGEPAGIGKRVRNFYASRFHSAAEVAGYVESQLDRLVRDTMLFRDTYFDTTLPYWFAQRVAMPLANLATETCQRWENGRFWAWEGVGCCFGTCTHVWNYAQGMGRVFPELERSVRKQQDFGDGFDAATGVVAVRGPGSRTATDGQAGAILKLFREYQMSPNDEFLRSVWTQARGAIEWLIQQDGNADGLIEGRQPNTYDISFVGANTYVGSLYLAALRAGEEMARRLGDVEYAARLRKIYESGRELSLQRLWNGEYFSQDKGAAAQNDQNQYGEGCLADQLFGQSWAHQLGLGYIYPEANVRSALDAVWKYNWAPDVSPQNRAHPPERFYARPGEAGLFICTWPRSKHPGERAVRYRDEVWTGIEYQVAANLLYDGKVQEGMAMVRAVHDRYDGARHNPWNEIECGDHYARALASWGCLLGVEGYSYEGPAAALGFAPRLSPEDFKAFFTGAEGWGSLVQKRDGARQVSRVDLRWGKLRLRTLTMEAPEKAQVRQVAVTVSGRPAQASFRQHGRRVVVTLNEDASLAAGGACEATLSW